MQRRSRKPPPPPDDDTNLTRAELSAALQDATAEAEQRVVKAQH
jgi:hypothetical protein